MITTINTKIIIPVNYSVKDSYVVTFFNDHFLLFVLASVVANHKTATEADVLNKIAGTLKYAPDEIGAGDRGKTVDSDE